MTDEEFSDAIDGLFAYDTGFVDSGIHDEVLRERVKREIERDADSQPFLTVGPRLTQVARHYIEEPYNLEDMACFIKWLNEYMGVEL